VEALLTVKRLDNVGIVVEDLDAAIEFFTDLGLELEARALIEGDWADGVTGLRDMRVEIAMLRTPDGHGRLEMSRFLTPPVVAGPRSLAPCRPDATYTPPTAIGGLPVRVDLADVKIT
jgi:catechol 2,3-dioxygenase-like lactoylglutathione lyase family enzyme